MLYRTTSYASYSFDAYWFEKNLQGDIVAVYSSSGTKLVSYKYDAWGNITTTYHNGGASTAAQYNPFKYRGYYHDSETGFYYLNSRYYDPATGRFLNADSRLNTSLGILGSNMYAYCLSNPTNKVDWVGNKPGDLFDTMEEAALDFGEYINAKSIEDNREYASYIYTKKVKETITITYVNPNLFGNNILSRFWNYLFRGGATRTETKTITTQKYTYAEPKRGGKDNVIRAVIGFLPRRKKAILHSHAAYVKGYNNDGFSDADIWLSDMLGVPIYVSTPLGTLRKYNPYDRTDIELFDSLPFDPNHPKR